MFYFFLKIFFYIVFLFLSLYGIMTLKDKLSSKEKEGFLEEKDTPSLTKDEDPNKAKLLESTLALNEEAEESTNRRHSLESNRSTNYSFRQEIMEDLSKKIETRLTTLKDAFAKEIDIAKETIDNNIKELIPNDDYTSNSSSIATLPSVKSFQLENTEISEDESSELDEESELEEEEVTETFDNGNFNGVTSPYCLNCLSYA